jgi:hypothetical protein
MCSLSMPPLGLYVLEQAGIKVYYEWKQASLRPPVGAYGYWQFIPPICLFETLVKLLVGQISLSLWDPQDFHLGYHYAPGILLPIRYRIFDLLELFILRS